VFTPGLLQLWRPLGLGLTPQAKHLPPPSGAEFLSSPDTWGSRPRLAIFRAFGARSEDSSEDRWFIRFRSRRLKEARCSAISRILINQSVLGVLGVLTAKRKGEDKPRPYDASDTINGDVGATTRAAKRRQMLSPGRQPGVWTWSFARAPEGGDRWIARGVNSPSTAIRGRCHGGLREGGWLAYGHWLVRASHDALWASVTPDLASILGKPSWRKPRILRYILGGIQFGNGHGHGYGFGRLLRRKRPKKGAPKGSSRSLSVVPASRAATGTR
jgi:hypothetical protein